MKLRDAKKLFNDGEVASHHFIAQLDEQRLTLIE